MPPYADIEKALVGWLGSQLTGIRVSTETPADLAAQLPLVQIARIGGPEIGLRLDAADIDVNVFGANRTSAIHTSELVRHAFRFALPGQQLGGSVFTRVDTLGGPAWRPYDNTTLRRFGMTYRVIVHHVSAA